MNKPKSFYFTEKPKIGLPEVVAISRGVFPSDPKKNVCDESKAVDAFEIGKYAVTIAQWQAVMRQLPEGNDELLPNHPVMNVNWFDVQAFITKLNHLNHLNKLSRKAYRLPTSVEWEYAARAGSTEDFCLSNMELYDSDKNNKIVNYDKNNKGIVPVGSLPPNPWGLHEMLGNIWEWVEYDKATVDHNAKINKTDKKELRGGCWASTSHEITLTAFAEHNKVACGWKTFGFRLAL